MVALDINIGLNAVIMAVTGGAPRVLTVHKGVLSEYAPAEDRPTALPFGPFEPNRHRTLELGLREWVEEQTGLSLGYVEQLYTFGDRNRDPRERADGSRVVSIGYLALVRENSHFRTKDAEWVNCYDFLPWEDWRSGRPPLLDQFIFPALEKWIMAEPEEQAQRAERTSIAFATTDSRWDIERVLDRYELLYEAGLVVEAKRDAVLKKTEAGVGRSFALDHRRMLATALARVRGKIKYRPLVFELLAPTFTLLKLQNVVEALSGVRLHKQNFRRLVTNNRLVEQTGNMDTESRGRPAALFEFRRDAVRERSQPGVGLPVRQSQ